MRLSHGLTSTPQQTTSEIWDQYQGNWSENQHLVACTDIQADYSYILHIHVLTYTWGCTWESVRDSLCLCVFMCVCVCEYVCVCLSVSCVCLLVLMCVRARVSDSDIHVYMNHHGFVCMLQVYICACVCTCPSMHTSIYVRTCVYGINNETTGAPVVSLV